MSYKLIRRRAANMPGLKVPVDVLEDLGKITEGAILWNIKHQMQADGQPLKENAPVTKRRKQRKGRTLKSLIDQFHRFTRGKGQSWAQQVEVARSWVIVTPATSELRDLSKWLQQRGYTGWFGTNARGVKSQRLRIRKWIRDEFEKAAKKSAPIPGTGK